MPTPPRPTKPRRFARLLAIAAGASAMFAITASLLVYAASEHRLDRTYGPRIRLPEAASPLREQGRHLAASRGCADCHGEDYGGKLIADEMPFARLVGTNLTQLPAGHEGRNVHEWMYLALHHGVGLDGRPLMMMPSKSFSSLSAHEIAALSAYFDSLAPVQRALPDSALGPLGRALLVAGRLPGFLSAEAIDHAAAAPARPPPLGTVEYGRHAAQLCSGCHRADFGGGRMTHGGPDLPPASNLTAHASGLAGWSEDDFIAALRSGRRPDGTAIDGAAMPWRAVGAASDIELHSLWLYLRSVPPVARDVRAEQ